MSPFSLYTLFSRLETERDGGFINALIHVRSLVGECSEFTHINCVPTSSHFHEECQNVVSLLILPPLLPHFTL